MKCPDAVDVLDADLGTGEHLLRVSNCRLFIGHKTHSIVFSLTVGTPVLGISFHPKTMDFMRLFDVADNCVAETDHDRHGIKGYGGSYS